MNYPDNRATSMGEMVRRIVSAELGDVWTGIPGVITSYDDDRMRASVQAILRRHYVDETGEKVVEKLPIIQNVPIIFPGTSGAGRRIDLGVGEGDHVWLMFSMSSLDKWLQYGGDDVDPTDSRRHAFSDAVALPGLMSFRHARQAAAQIVFTETEIHVGGSDSLAELADLTSLQNVFATTALPGGATPADVYAQIVNMIVNVWNPVGTTVTKGT